MQRTLYAVRRRASSSTRTHADEVMSRPANNANMQTSKLDGRRRRGHVETRPRPSRSGLVGVGLELADSFLGSGLSIYPAASVGRKKAEAFQRLSKRTKERRSSYTPLLTDTQEGTVVDVSCPSLSLSVSLSLPVSRNSVVDEYVVVDLRFLKGTAPPN